MPNATAEVPVNDTEGTPPVDLETIRKTAEDVITDGARIEEADELQTIILLLRGLITLLIPHVEAATGNFPRNHTPAICARACIGEGRMRLRLEASDSIPQLVGLAQRLARTVMQLADHYEELGCEA